MIESCRWVSLDALLLPMVLRARTRTKYTPDTTSVDDEPRIDEHTRRLTEAQSWRLVCFDYLQHARFPPEFQCEGNRSVAATPFVCRRSDFVSEYVEASPLQRCSRAKCSRQTSSRAES